MPRMPGTGEPRRRPWVRVSLCLACLLLLLVPWWSTPATATDPVDRVPERLPDQVATLEQRLVNLSQAQEEAMARMWPAVEDAARGVLGPAADLTGRHGELLASYIDQLDTEVAAGNTTNVRSLARSAAGLVADEICPAVETWARQPTTLTLGEGRMVDEVRVRVPVVMVHPPPGGVGAVDVSVATPATGWYPVEASIETGQGQAHVDPVNGTARLASFDAKSLAKLSSVRAGVVIGHVVLQGGSQGDEEGGQAEIRVHAVADRDGQELPALGAPAEIQASHTAAAGWQLGAWGAAAVVGGLGLGAVIAARRFLEV